MQRASGLHVLHYTAVESEAELPFASLQALLRSLLGHLPEIPEPQALITSAAELAHALVGEAGTRVTSV